MTVGEALRAGAGRLAGRSETPRLDAELLLAEVLGCGRARLIADGREPMDAAANTRFDALLQRRADGEPVAYLRGRREFWGLELAISPAVLDPRPDTECLVEQALHCLSDLTDPRVLDLGTGSGAVALAIAHQRPDARVTAVDNSADALAVARANGERLGLSRVRWLAGDWFAPVAGERFELVVANPPYLAADDPHLASLIHEPDQALVADDDGLACLHRIIDLAPDHLADGGALWLEHGDRQAAAVRARLIERGYTDVGTRADAAGRDRISGGRRR